ncbi:MAG: glucose 1-dehydrogenase [Dehalococcoidales bacterium]|nr:glucose 1-dehydrogenase [Dehalococcoidales bacterium]
MALPSLSLKGKTAIVTGSRRGIGKEIALMYAEAGADVALFDVVVDDGLLAGVADQIKKMGRRALAIQTDVSRRTDVEKSVKQAESELGKIDILVNDAVIMVRKPMIEATEEDWNKCFDVGLKGYFFCTTTVMKGMMKRKSGCIVNVASVAAFHSSVNRAAYSIAKAGIAMMTRQYAMELGPYNIRTNAIGPGLVPTPMNEDLRKDPELEKGIAARTPLRRMGAVREVAAVALFLASDAASFVNGVTILVDGGSAA